MHLSKKKARLNQILALLLCSIIGLLFYAVIQKLPVRSSNTFYILVAIGLLVCYNIYSIFTKKFRDRARLVKTPFPEAWKKILQQYVSFYRLLSEAEQRLFETELQIFLHETRITGIKTEVDDVTMLLAASSAEIVVFGFPEWEYENLGEILIYPGSFNRNFKVGEPNSTITGMVGTGLMNGVMILSKPHLIAGFQYPMDRRNVGIHEFAHLLDASDGSYDGVPSRFLEHQYIAPWLEVVRQEIEHIHEGTSIIHPYGGTNTTEFFAVATEHFFEQPAELKANNPEVYELLSKVFKQDPKNRFQNALLSLFNYTGNTVGRNAPCPCASGAKYKHCCLKNARQY